MSDWRWISAAVEKGEHEHEEGVAVVRGNGEPLRAKTVRGRPRGDSNVLGR